MKKTKRVNKKEYRRAKRESELKKCTEWAKKIFWYAILKGDKKLWTENQENQTQ